MKRTDGHVHLEHGPLTETYVRRFVEQAQQAQLDCLQILDHTHRFKEFRPAYRSVIDADPTQARWLSGRGKFKDSLTDYLDLVRRLREVSWPLEVRFGLEVCYTPESELFLKELCTDLPLDFLVGSVHSIDGYLYDMNFSKPLLWAKHDHQALTDRYLQCVLQAVQSGLFDQIGHPDTVKVMAEKAVMAPSMIRTIALEAQLRGIALECNTGCHWRYGHADYGLSEAWLPILAETGVWVITASDAHDPQHVNHSLEQARMRLLHAGCLSE